MTTEEFSNEFDTLIDAYSQSLPFGASLDPPHFNEYEKSVFLTRAQELFILSYYSTATGGEAFETTEEIRRYLDLLVITEVINEETSHPTTISDSFKHSIFSLPANIWFIVYELAHYRGTAKCIGGFAAEIVPVTHDSYYRTTQNPFRGPSRKRVLRLDSGLNTVELVSKYDIGTYVLRYIAKPSPIILADFTGGLTIDDKFEKLTCQLHTALHRKILEVGVQLALLSRVRETNNDKQK